MHTSYLSQTHSYLWMESWPDHVCLCSCTLGHTSFLCPNPFLCCPFLGLYDDHYCGPNVDDLTMKHTGCSVQNFTFNNLQS